MGARTGAWLFAGLAGMPGVCLADASLPWTAIFESPESSIHVLREAPDDSADSGARNPTTRVWYLEDRKIAVMLSLLNMKTYSSQIQRWDVDCRARAYRMTGAVYFDGHMGEGKPLRTAAGREGFEIAPANPMMNALFAAVCGSSAIKPITPRQRAALPALTTAPIAPSTSTVLPGAAGRP